MEEGGIIPTPGRSNITNISDINDLNRGEKVTRKELKVMLRNANPEQESVFRQVKNEFETSSITFVSDAAATGNSYILRMFERYYRLKGFKVCVLLRQYKLKSTSVGIGLQISTNRCSGPQHNKADITSIFWYGKSVKGPKFSEFR